MAGADPGVVIAGAATDDASGNGVGYDTAAVGAPRIVGGERWFGF